jgi:hypothetical protein
MALSGMTPTEKSLSAIRSFSDGAGTLIQNGQIIATNADLGSVTSDTNIINHSVQINGNVPSTSTTTGTLSVQGGGIGTSGNINLNKSLNLWDATQRVTTSNIEPVDGTNPIGLYSTPNSSGIALGNSATTLTILSPCVFSSGVGFTGGSIIAQSIQQQTSTLPLACWTVANSNGLTFGNLSLNVRDNSTWNHIGVHTFQGNTAFGLLPTCSTSATTNTQFCNLLTLNNSITALKAATNTWGGVQTFTNPPISSTTPTTTTQLTNKTYVDTQLAALSTNLLTNNNTWSGWQRYNSTLNATSGATGSLSTAGGIGCAQDAFVGGMVLAQTAVAATGQTTNNDSSIGGSCVIGSSVTIGKNILVSGDAHLFGNTYTQIPPQCTQLVPTLPQQLSTKYYTDLYPSRNNNWTGANSFSQAIGLPGAYSPPASGQLGYQVAASAVANLAIASGVTVSLCSAVLPAGRWLCHWGIKYYLVSGVGSTLSTRNEGVNNTQSVVNSQTPATMTMAAQNELFSGTSSSLKSGSCIVDSTTWGSSTVYLMCSIVYSASAFTTSPTPTGCGFTLTRIA